MSSTPLLRGGRNGVADSSTGRPYGATAADADASDVDVAQPPPSPRHGTASSSSLHSIAALWRGYANPEKLSRSSDAARAYYLAQNEQLRAFRALAATQTGLSRDDERFLAETSECSLSEDTAVEEEASVQAASDRLVEENDRYVRRAVFSSNVANFVLIFAQLFVFLKTQSMTMLAVLVDASLDVIAGLVILATYLMRKRSRDVTNYPVGRTRLEPLGIMLVACLMTASTMSAIMEAFHVLLGGQGEAAVISLPSFVIVGFALITKGALYLYCRSSTDASVEALATDHYNDVLSSSTAIATLVVTQHISAAWWLDPVGGIVISLFIVRNWADQVSDHCDKLLSRTADRQFLNQVVYVCLIHSPANIRKVDTVRGYHVGPGIYVECDIVLDPDVPLMYAHDIGESLQRRVELLEGVERCFVHLDTESEHSPSYEHKDIA